MIKSFVCISLFTILFTERLYSQSLEKPDSIEDVSSIFTDRPGETESPSILTHKCFQYETGAVLKVYNKSDIQIKDISYSTNLIRYGISRHIEFRMILEYLGNRITGKSEGLTSHVEGFSPLTIGAKIFICEEHGIIPKVSLLTHLNLPYIGKSEFRPQFIAPALRMLAVHNFSDQLSFSYNLGAEWDGVSPNATGVYTASLDFSLNKRISMFVESYGFLREKSEPVHIADAGFTYLINNNVQLDASGGLGLTPNAPDFFLDAGVSFRIDTKRK